jgi:hypothetical protein
MRHLALALLTLLVAGCATPTMVPLLTAAGVPVTATPSGQVPMEVVTRGTGVPDPLPVHGTGTAYGDVEGALGHAVSSAVVPWADTHRDVRPGGWTLTVELTKAEASWSSGRMKTTLGVRATLRARSNNEYLAQTATYCSDSALVPAEQGAAVMYSCMSRIGRDLAGWLGGIQP